MTTLMNELRSYESWMLEVRQLIEDLEGTNRRLRSLLSSSPHFADKPAETRSPSSIEVENISQLTPNNSKMKGTASRRETRRPTPYPFASLSLARNDGDDDDDDDGIDVSDISNTLADLHFSLIDTPPHLSIN